MLSQATKNGDSKGSEVNKNYFDPPPSVSLPLGGGAVPLLR